MGPSQSSKDLMFYEPKNHVELLSFALCADFMFIRECCKFSTDRHARESPGDAISRRPMPEFIVFLEHDAIALLAGKEMPFT